MIKQSESPRPHHSAAASARASGQSAWCKATRLQCRETLTHLCSSLRWAFYRWHFWLLWRIKGHHHTHKTLIPDGQAKKKMLAFVWFFLKALYTWRNKLPLVHVALLLIGSVMWAVSLSVVLTGSFHSHLHFNMNSMEPYFSCILTCSMFKGCNEITQYQLVEKLH